MTTFDDREKAEELRFVHKEELAFKARARRDRQVGLWAAAKLGLAGAAAEAYGDALVAFAVSKSGDEEIVAKLVADLAPAGIAEHTIRHQLDEQFRLAVEHIKTH